MIGFNNLGTHGRLGNQMFQYSALRGIASRHGYEFVIPPSEFKDVRKHHQLFETFRLPHLKQEGWAPQRILRERCFRFDRELFETTPDDVSLLGYFQTERYFQHISASLRDDFVFHDEILEPCRRAIRLLDNPIALHVRRTDYLGLSHVHPVLSEQDYYSRALERFPNDRQVLVFSDDPQWCKHQPIFATKRFTVSSFDDNRFALCLMTLSHDYIIANSSFSWWGAWLSRNPNPTVYAPKRWFSVEDPKHDTRDLIPAGWVKV